jgi:hypothetical protein
MEPAVLIVPVLAPGIGAAPGQYFTLHAALLSALKFASGLL